MLKEHIHDLYTEGLGDIFFMKYYNFLKNNIKNDAIRGLLMAIHVLVYLTFLLMVAFIIFKLSWPL